MNRCDTCAHRGAYRCAKAESVINDPALSPSEWTGDAPPPEWCPGYLPMSASEVAVIEDLSSVPDPQPKSRGRRARAEPVQQKPDARPQIVAVHFRDVVPGIDMRGFSARAYKRDDANWRGWDVEIVPGFVVMTAPERDGKRAVFRVPDLMCVVVTEVAAP